MLDPKTLKIQCVRPFATRRKRSSDKRGERGGGRGRSWDKIAEIDQDIGLPFDLSA